MQGSFSIFSILIPALREVFLGGGQELSAYLTGGVAEMRAICVQGGGGSKKAEKLRAYYINGPYVNKE